MSHAGVESCIIILCPRGELNSSASAHRHNSSKFTEVLNAVGVGSSRTKLRCIRARTGFETAGADAVDAVEGGNFIALGKRRIVEDGFHKVVDRHARRHE